MANQEINDLAQATLPIDPETTLVELDAVEAGVRVSRKININDLVPPATATTAELDDITASVNTDESKVAGYEVFNTTSGRPVWAIGSADGSVWNFADGTLAHTPV